MDGMLLQTVEGLGDSPFVGSGGQIWEWLQAEKEEVCHDLLAGGPLCQSDAHGVQELEAPEESDREIEWRHRAQLEARLREVNDAQDRLLDGAYGCCQFCGEQIDAKRLQADPAVSLCLECQRTADTERGSCRHYLGISY
jgi:RNA polymerase-binding transcription factor DksA